MTRSISSTDVPHSTIFRLSSLLDFTFSNEYQNPPDDRDNWDRATHNDGNRFFIPDDIRQFGTFSFARGYPNDRSSIRIGASGWIILPAVSGVALVRATGKPFMGRSPPPRHRVGPPRGGRLAPPGEAIPPGLPLDRNGEGGIRTPGTLSSTLDFETSPISRSGTSPTKDRGWYRTPRNRKRDGGRTPAWSSAFAIAAQPCRSRCAGAQ